MFTHDMQDLAMAKLVEVFKKLISHSKEYGFVFQSSEIYED